MTSELADFYFIILDSNMIGNEGGIEYHEEPIEYHDQECYFFSLDCDGNTQSAQAVVILHKNKFIRLCPLQTFGVQSPFPSRYKHSDSLLDFV